LSAHSWRNSWTFKVQWIFFKTEIFFFREHLKNPCCVVKVKIFFSTSIIDTRLRDYGRYFYLKKNCVCIKKLPYDLPVIKSSCRTFNYILISFSCSDLEFCGHYCVNWFRYYQICEEILHKNSRKINFFVMKEKRRFFYIHKKNRNVLSIEFSLSHSLTQFYVHTHT